MSRAAPAVALLAAVALVGGVVAWIASADPGAPAAAGGATATGATPATEARIAELERRLAALEQRGSRGRVERSPDGASVPAASDPSGGGGSASPPGAPAGDGASGESGTSPEGAAAPVPDDAFVASVRSALERIRQEDARREEIQKLRGEREKATADLDRRLAEIATRLNLDDATVASVKQIAQTGIDDLLRAKARGAGAEELQTIERNAHRSVRDLVGNSTYREIRRLELDSTARSQVAKIAAQAGVDRDQRDRIESLVSAHIDSLVDDDVRVRTADLTAEERAEIGRRSTEATRTLWDRIRNEVLDDVQRERVPLKIR